MDTSVKKSTGVRILCILLGNRVSRPVTQKFGGIFLKYFPGQITCEEFEAFVIDYYENRLPISEREIFDRHMRVCPMCKSSFAAYIKTIELGKSICQEEEHFPSFANAPSELIEAILSATVGRNPQRGPV